MFLDSQLRDDRGVNELLSADYTFVNDRLARHYGTPRRVRQPFPPRDAAGEPAGRTARSRQHPDRDLDARIAPRRSCAASGCSRTSSGRQCQHRRRTSHHSRRRAQRGATANGSSAYGGAPEATRCARAAMPSWIRSAFRSNKFDAIGRWRETDGGRAGRLDRGDARRSDHRRAAGAAGVADGPPRTVRPHGDGEAADLRYRPRRRVRTTCRRSAGSCATRPEPTTVGRRSSWGSRRATISNADREE